MSYSVIRSPLTTSLLRQYQSRVHWLQTDLTISLAGEVADTARNGASALTQTLFRDALVVGVSVALDAGLPWFAEMLLIVMDGL